MTAPRNPSGVPPAVRALTARGSWTCLDYPLLMAVDEEQHATVVHAGGSNAVAFMVIDRSGDDGARGGDAQDLLDVVRPPLEWSVGNDARAPLPDGAVRR